MIVSMAVEGLQADWKEMIGDELELEDMRGWEKYIHFGYHYLNQCNHNATVHRMTRSEPHGSHAGLCHGSTLHDKGRFRCHAIFQYEKLERFHRPPLVRCGTSLCNYPLSMSIGMPIMSLG